MVLLASVGEGFSIDIWDADDDYRHITTLRGHQGRVLSLQFSQADERVLGSASRDRSVIVWDIPDNRLIHKLPHEHSVDSITFTRGMDRLVTRTTLDKIFVWDLIASPSPCILSSIEFRSTTESSICLSSDGSKIISSYAKSEYSLFEDYFAVWSMESRDGEHELLSTTQDTGCFQDIKYIAINPVDDSIATANRSFLVFIWEYHEDQPRLRKRGELFGHTDRVTCCSYFPDGSQLVSGSEDRTYKIWDVISLSLLLSVDTQRAVFSIACTREFVACGGSIAITVFSAQTSEKLKTWNGDGLLSRVAYSAPVVVLL
jgi:WD40 repeat protein